MRNPNRRSTIGMIVFIPIAPNTLATVIRPDWKGGEAKAELQAQRQQERHAADAGTVHDPPTTAARSVGSRSSERSRIGAGVRRACST